MIVEALRYNSSGLGHYCLHAFAVMPNHVHLLATPAVELPRLTKSLKGITAKRANALLGTTGRPFWQAESYDQFSYCTSRCECSAWSFLTTSGLGRL